MKVFGSSLTSPSLSLAISHTHIYRWFCRRAAVPGQPAGSSCRASVGCRREPPAASGTPTRAARKEQSCRHPVFSTASPGTDLQPPQFTLSIFGNRAADIVPAASNTTDLCMGTDAKPCKPEQTSQSWIFRHKDAATNNYLKLLLR
jgi:hypothetical protein